MTEREQKAHKRVSEALRKVTWEFPYHKGPMKQQNEVRTLAVRLFEAGQREKQKQPAEIWSGDRFTRFCDLTRHEAAVWDAIAVRALDEFVVRK